MAGQTLLALSFAALLLIGGESATFTIKNNCPMTIWPAAFTGEGSQPSTTGFELASQASNTIDVPSPAKTSGRIWARTYCTATCLTGECGQGGGPCSGATGVPPATLVEFTLNDNGGLDTYDISNVDGSNLRVTLAPDNSACVTTSCLGDINADCPADLARKSGSETVGCLSDCAALNRPEDCCTGAFNTTQTCQPSRSANYFKEKCPQAYGYAFHDQSSTFTCATGTNYQITFCP
ncbi:thaumatin-like protein 1 [Daucus carota subsp. sativus]|nr:PREDICTED: thaumatin-like protein 1 [Daucus carota subsp. sativus]